MDYVSAWEEPDYPHGDWISQQEWIDTGIEEVFKYAEASEGSDLSQIDIDFSHYTAKMILELKD